PPLMVVVEAGGGDYLAGQCAALGLRLSDHPVAGNVCLLAGVAEADSVRRGLRPPFGGFVELGGEGLLGVGLRCFDTARGGGLALSLTTASAYALGVMELLGEAVRRDFILADRDVADMIDICIAEAIGNAVIHGNLGIPGHLRATAKGFQRFCRIMEERLNDPVLSGRRVEINMSSNGAGYVRASVSDQGHGFDLAARLSRAAGPDATHGRGLGVIRKACSALHGEDGGRTLVMLFNGRSPAEAGDEDNEEVPGPCSIE
ncbi:ATP-binding protein, partial [Magnetospirillum sp. SS-4]|uniref:ATP-binding protein n=1 Tax=Magnetospirillum sp. SS-4 TaxID=2681465 RepID=UPI001573B7FB